MVDSLIFDRITVDAVDARALGDGAAFNVRVWNVGEGRQETQVIRAEVSGTAIACLAAKGRSVEDWEPGLSRGRQTPIRTTGRSSGLLRTRTRVDSTRVTSWISPPGQLWPQLTASILNAPRTSEMKLV
jgi:hypothetical protein